MTSHDSFMELRFNRLRHKLWRRLRQRLWRRLNTGLRNMLIEKLYKMLKRRRWALLKRDNPGKKLNLRKFLRLSNHLLISSHYMTIVALHTNKVSLTFVYTVTQVKCIPVWKIGDMYNPIKELFTKSYIQLIIGTWHFQCASTWSLFQEQISTKSRVDFKLSFVFLWTLSIMFIRLSQSSSQHAWHLNYTATNDLANMANPIKYFLCQVFCSPTLSTWLYVFTYI